MSNLFTEIYGSDALSEAEKARLKAISDGIQRQRKLSAVATMSSDEGMRGVGRVLGVNAESDSDRASQRFADEAASAAQLRKDLQSAADRKADREFRERQQADLQEYRRQSLVNAQLARAQSGRITPYQQAQLDLQRRKLDAAAGAKQTADTARQRATLAQRYAASGVPQLVASANVANTQLGQYKDRDIPGIGPVENWLPDFAVGEEAQLTRSRIAGIANQLLKLRSGAAVTAPEMQRFLTELATGKGVSEEVFRQRWPEVMQIIEAEQSAIMGGYPGVADQYLQESGLPRFKASNPFAQQPGAPQQPAQGRSRGRY